MSFTITNSYEFHLYGYDTENSDSVLHPEFERKSRLEIQGKYTFSTVPVFVFSAYNKSVIKYLCKTINHFYSDVFVLACIVRSNIFLYC